MDIKQCPNCQKQFDQDKRVSKQLSCGCVSCLKCLNFLYKLTQKIECTKHKQIYNINPEELQTFVVQEQVQLQVLEQPQEQFIYQEQINEQFRCLQDMYVKKQNHNREILKEIQDSSYFFQHIQSLSMQLILKVLIDQFSLSNDKRESLLKRLSELQVIYEVYQEQQALSLAQQDPNIRQNLQDQLQQQFQQIVSEIEELKKDQWMDFQSLRVNIQRCMFRLFVYLSESSNGQLLTVNEAELLVQKYFNQFKVQNNHIQISNSLVQQKSYLQSQNIDQKLSQENQIIDQQQNQIIDKTQDQDLVQIKQFQISQEIPLQERQIIYVGLMFQQLEQKMMNLSNDFGFIDQINLSIQEQAITFMDITFDNLLQFLNQIKYENMSLQALKSGPLNNSELLEYPQILNQLHQVNNQQICLKLIQILNLSKNQTQLQQTAANALTMINYMNFDFTNIDFSNLDLTKSDLSDTTFTNCNFSNSNLTSASLRNSKFINCDFTSSNLTSIVTEHPHIFTGHTNSVYAVAISSDSELIVSGSQDNTVRLWDVKTGTCKTMSGHTSSVWSVAISSDSEFIVSGSGDNTVRLWDVKTGNSQTMSGHTSSVYAVAISSDSGFIVSGSVDNTVRLWDVKTGNSQTMSGHTNSVNAVAISSDSEFIVSGSLDNTVRLWDVKTGKSYTMNGHAKAVNSVSISNDSQFIISGSDDETIRIWSTKTQQCIRVLSGHSDSIYSVIFSSSNSNIISGSYDKAIRVWNFQSGECICVFCGHTDNVGSLSLSKDNNWLVSSKKYYSGQ